MSINRHAPASASETQPIATLHEKNDDISAAATETTSAQSHVETKRLEDRQDTLVTSQDAQDHVGAKTDADQSTVAPLALPETHQNGLHDQTTYLPARKIIVVLLAMQAAVFMAFLDQSIVSTALPNISSAFDAGRASSWVASSYLLTSTAFQPLWGRASDIFGRKITLIACVVVFLLGSLACALAQSMTQLIIFRGLQGAGGGGLLTLVLIVISDICSLRERGRYQGITEGVIAIANGVGPLLGGVFSEKISWRWCFWINLPIGGVGVGVIYWFLPLKGVRNSIKKKLSQIDYLGSFLTMAATVLLLLPINWGGTSFSWSSSVVIGCLVGSGVAFLIFFVWETRARIPIVPLKIFRVPTVACVLFNTFISGATILVQIFYIPQYIQIVRGDSAIRSGVLVLPLLLVTTASVFVSGQVVARTGEYKYHIVGGYACWCLSLGLQSTLDQNSSTAKLVGFLILTGAGQGQTLQTSMVAAQAAVERSEMSVVTSTRVFVRSLGGTVFLAVAAAIINNSLRHDLIPRGFTSGLVSTIIDDPTALWRASTHNGSILFDLNATQKGQIIEAYVRGFRTLFLALVGMQGLNCVLATIFIRRINLTRGDEDALKERGKQMLAAKKAKKQQRKVQQHESAPSDVDLEKGDSK
ncbi:hypothetical protein OIO90_000510 [Microbotryomycetes sp. JL221]|nr:hypothetical protein OIO90_000510 [Microbotryomycetes sp. JL221]